MSLCLCFLLFFFLLHCNTCVSLPRVETCKILTVHFNFTKANRSVKAIPLRIRGVSSVVVVNYVSPVGRTSDVDKIKYRGSGVVGVPKTQHSILFVSCVGDVHGKSQ